MREWDFPHIFRYGNKEVRGIYKFQGKIYKLILSNCYKISENNSNNKFSEAWGNRMELKPPTPHSPKNKGSLAPFQYEFCGHSHLIEELLTTALLQQRYQICGIRPLNKSIKKIDWSDHLWSENQTTNGPLPHHIFHDPLVSRERSKNRSDADAAPNRRVEERAEIGGRAHFLGRMKMGKRKLMREQWLRVVDF